MIQQYQRGVEEDEVNGRKEKARSASPNGVGEKESIAGAAASDRPAQAVLGCSCHSIPT